MHYRIRKDKKEEVQEGRTLQYISDICDYSRQHITYIFNGNVDATEKCATDIIKYIAEDSIKIAIRLNQQGMKNTLNYFFEEVD